MVRSLRFFIFRTFYIYQYFPSNQNIQIQPKKYSKITPCFSCFMCRFTQNNICPSNLDTLELTTHRVTKIPPNHPIFPTIPPYHSGYRCSSIYLNILLFSPILTAFLTFFGYLKLNWLLYHGPTLKWDIFRFFGYFT